MGRPAFAATVAVTSIPAARPNATGNSSTVSTIIAGASTPVRFRVSGPVMLILTTAGIGKGVENGTPTKGVDSSESVYKT